MRRRALLASTAALTSVAAAGCLGSVGGADTVTAGDTLTLGGLDFELGSPRVQSTFVDQQWPYWDAKGSDDRVFAAVPLSPTDDGKNPQDAVGDARILADLDGERPLDSGATRSNRDDQPPLLVGVPFPTGSDADAAAVVFENAGGERLELDDDQRAYVADPPALSVDPRIPEETDGNSLTVGLDVTNDGDRAAVLGWTCTHGRIADAWWTHRSTVPARETQSLRQSFDRIGDPDPGTDLGVRLDWGYDDRVTEVRVTRN